MPNTFASLIVPTSDQLSGDAFDVRQTGPAKTFVFDGVVRPGGRYIVEGSADGGDAWDILTGRDGTPVFFTADRQGTRTLDVLCRFLRVQREAGGVSPIISVGSEGLPRVDDRCPVESLSLQEEKTAGVQTLVAEWLVDFDTISGMGETIGA